MILLRKNKSLMITLKEKSDRHVIDSAFKRIAASKSNDLETHLVFAGDYYHWSEERLRSIVLKGMTKYNIEYIMVTNLFMENITLITKEAMEHYSKQSDSVMDDLETFIEDIRLGKKSYRRVVLTFYLPKAGFQIYILYSASDWMIFQERRFYEH